MQIASYAKSIVFVIAAALTVLAAALTDDVVSSGELVNIGIAVVTATGVYFVPNLATGIQHYAKGAVAFLGAGLVALASLLTDGVTNAEWIMVALAALGAIGVVIVPNTLPRGGNLSDRAV